MNISAQDNNKEINLILKNEKLSGAFKQLEKVSGYKCLFTYDDMDGYSVSATIKTHNINEAIKSIIGKFPLDYTIQDGYVTITKRVKRISERVTPEEEYNTTVIFQGWVHDGKRQPLTGVSVVVKNSTNGVFSDADGTFALHVPKGKPVDIVFSFLGMENITYHFDPKQDELRLTIFMKEKESELEEVVVTGMFTRRADSFTGAAVTIKQEELKKAGNQNILQSLKNIDPAFTIVENISFGANPNALPEIQMRGENSIGNLQGSYDGNPNQPLFILDGFETTLQKIYDLDMNRVESITLLKDAAAKAIYGSKAANGVVVIQTIRPQTGELRISYSGDFNVEVPDLTGYNLMNANDKLAFELERGMYSKYSSNASTSQFLDDLYKQNYDNIAKGVNTYWLSRPLRTGIGSKHSLNLEGGDNRISYQLGVSYNNITGVMKGSERNTLSINTGLSYTYKNLIFRNNIEYTRNSSQNSPYGSFSQYIGLNQYYSPYDSNGNITKILGQNRVGNVYNPLYNGTLNTKSTSGYSDLTNNFNVDWKIASSLRLTGSISYTRNENQTDEFNPPSHTMFAEYDQGGLSDRKGKYTSSNGYYQYIIANAGLNFNKSWDKHLIFANGTWNLSDKRTVSRTIVAEGFGNDNMDDISFASQYEESGKPSGTDSKIREIGLVGTFNYAYDNRYLFDASLRTSGSSMYGNQNRWGSFWSLGAGWNLHHEKFMKQLAWLDHFKLRSSYGYTGSQNFDPFQARSRYVYGDIVYNGRLGAELMGLPNDYLRWQRTMDFNTGLDLSIKRFVNARFDYYVSTTSDLLTDMSTVPSMGFSSYKENLGEVQNKGYEFMVALTPWRNDKQRGWVTISVTAIHNENKIKRIYDIFKSWNESQDEELDTTITADNSGTDELQIAYTRPKTYHYEGQSLTAIRGVRSLGIDPMTGEEMYLDKNGNSTWVWNSADQVVIGDANPKLRGTLGLSGGVKGFSLSIACSYKYGGDIYNTTLIDRVENVSGYDNLDKRILDSWRNVGDISPYRALNISAQTTATYTKPTSRFVEKNNELYISTLNISYEFSKQKWFSAAGLKRLKCSFYMNELLRLSTVKIERGTSYPFARTYSFSLQASF